MAEEKSAQQRTEQPTERRLSEARKKGQVPRSRELNTFLCLMAAASFMLFLRGGMVEDFTQLAKGAFSLDRPLAFDAVLATQHFMTLLLGAITALIPFFALMVIAVFAGPLLMGGWAFSVSALAFKFEKLNPLTGLGRIFSAKGAVELVKALLKSTLVVVAAVLLFKQLQTSIVGLGYKPTFLALAESFNILLGSLFALTSVLLLIVAIDVPFELWNHRRQLKMTRQEVKDELKESEGRPEVKGRIRELQREIAQQRMMEAVPSADVIITNPTHFAVALKYQGAAGSAPVVVAKGRDLVALRIRELAMEHKVAIFSAPLLARALHGSTRIGEEIPQDLYLAVARVLAYVYQVNNAVSGNIAPPEDLPVPDSYQKYAQDLDNNE